MRIIIDEYINKIDGFADLPFTEQTKYLAYFYVKNTKDELFTPKNIKTFFELASLPEPKNISDIFKKLSDKKKPDFLKRGPNYTFHRNTFREIEEKINGNHEEKTPVEEKTSFKKLFSDKLTKKISKDFEVELKDLQLVFGRSGTCTAFLLRKILEKMLFLTFAKNNKIQKIQKDGEIIGLKNMIKEATKNKISGIFILTPKTGKNINGIKFLGDSAAHNPIVNVEMETIIPQMPFIITAYEELANKL